MTEGGKYKLQTVNGSPVPPAVTVRVENGVSTAVRYSEIVLIPPHGFEGFFHYEINGSPGKEGWDVASGGRYAKSGGTNNFEFLNPNDGQRETGTIIGGILTLYAGTGVFVYQR